MVVERRKCACAKLKFDNALAYIVYSVFVYFSAPYLSVLGGIAAAFLVIPVWRLELTYSLLLEYVPARTFGLFMAMLSAAVWIMVMRIGPRICGLCLPTVRCFTKRQLKVYVALMILQWISFSGISIYSFHSVNPVGGITYGLLGISVLVRLGSATTGLIPYE